MILTVKINAPIEAAQGVKEMLAMDLERFGGVQIVDITDDEYGKQMVIGAITGPATDKP